MVSLCLPGLFTIWPCDKHQSAPNTVKHICQTIRGRLFPNSKVNWPMTSHNCGNDFLKSHILEIICTQYDTVFSKVMYSTQQNMYTVWSWSFQVLPFLLCRQCRLLIIMQSRKLLTNLLYSETARMWLDQFQRRTRKLYFHDDVMRWKYSPRYWPLWWKSTGGSPTDIPTSTPTPKGQ